MKLSIVVAYYKNTSFLSLVLAGLHTQSHNNFEVIIADDDNSQLSVDFISEYARHSAFPLLHVHQSADDGFRKNQVLNKAILKSSGDIIVFIDGDCIPHKHFVKEYAKNIHEKTALFGRRVMLSQALTQQLSETHNLGLLSLASLLITRSKNIKDALYLPFINRSKTYGIWGCNWGIYKKHLLEVNGFDEDYIRAGVGEDVDIEARLKILGVKLQSVKHKAIVYHLYHQPNYSEADIQYNFAVLEEKQKEGLAWCRNGIVKDE